MGAETGPHARSAPEWRRRGLTRWGRRIAVAAAEAFLAERGSTGCLESPDSLHCQRVVEVFDLAIGGASPNLRVGMAGLLATIEWLPLLVVQRLRRMSRLPLVERVAYLQALEDSSIGILAMLVVGLKIPMTIYAFEQGAGLVQTGFERPSISSPRRRQPRAIAEDA